MPDPRKLVKIRITIASDRDPADPAIDAAIIEIVENHRCGYGGTSSTRIWDGFLGAEQGGNPDGDLSAALGAIATSPIVERLVVEAAEEE